MLKELLYDASCINSSPTELRVMPEQTPAFINHDINYTKTDNLLLSLLWQAVLWAARVSTAPQEEKKQQKTNKQKTQDNSGLCKVPDSSRRLKKSCNQIYLSVNLGVLSSFAEMIQFSVGKNHTNHIESN